MVSILGHTCITQIFNKGCGKSAPEEVRLLLRWGQPCQLRQAPPPTHTTPITKTISSWEQPEKSINVRFLHSKSATYYV